MTKNRFYSFGIRGEIPAKADESRILHFILSSYRKDRHGTILNQENWMLDNYRKNPVVAYAHNLGKGLITDPNPDFVIGKSTRIWIEGKGKTARLEAEAQFEDAAINPMAEKIFRKLLFGSLSATSVGFMELGEGKYGIGDEALGRNNETYYFDGQELLEWSVVNVPSNPDAGKRKVKDGGIAAISYAARSLSWSNLRPSKIEDFTVENILTLLDGIDANILMTDPSKVRKALDQLEQERLDAEIEAQRAKFREDRKKEEVDRLENLRIEKAERFWRDRNSI
jgi:hypothetical protein